MNNKYAYATLLASDDYLPGVIGLWTSLKNLDSKYPLHVIVTDNVSQNSIQQLNNLNIKYTIFPLFSLGYISMYYNISNNKLWAYDLVEYDKILILNADIIVYENIDDIFLEEPVKYFAPGGNFWEGIVLIKPQQGFFNGCKKNIIEKYDSKEAGWERIFNNLPSFARPVEELNIEYLKRIYYDIENTKAREGVVKYWKKYDLNSASEIETFITTHDLRGLLVPKNAE